MPIYDYACTDCGRVVEVVHGVNGQGPQACETCGGPMKKLLLLARRALQGLRLGEEGPWREQRDQGGRPQLDERRELGRRRRASVQVRAGRRGDDERAGRRHARRPATDPVLRCPSPPRTGSPCARRRTSSPPPTSAISRDTLARWAKSGKLQSIRPGRLIYVRRAQVRSMLTPKRRGVPIEQLQPGLFEDWDG